MKKRLPGLLITLSIAIFAKFISSIFMGIGAITLALLLGIIAGNLINFSPVHTPGIRFSEKKILEFAIVLMGFNLQLDVVTKLGSEAFLIVIPLMAITIITGIIISTAFGNSLKFGTLIGVGSAVCGASAIAAVAPSVNAKENELGVSIGVVNLLGTLGIFLLPPLGYFLNFSDIEQSYLIGGTLQAIGHVIAAGFSVNDTVGDTATLIKMIRVLMIGPVALIAAFLFSSSTPGSPRKLQVPGFIIGFIICSILGTLLQAYPQVVHQLSQLSKFLLAIAMAAIGIKIRYIDLIKQGPKALVIGAIIFSVQVLLIAGVLYLR